MRAGAAGIVEYRDINAVEVDRRRRQQAPGRAEAQRRTSPSWTPRAASSSASKVPYGADAAGQGKRRRSRPASSSPSGIRTARRSWPRRRGKVEFQDIEEGETVRAESEGKDGAASASWSSSTRANATRRSRSSIRPTARFSTSTTCRPRPVSKSTNGQMIAAGQHARPPAARNPRARRTSPSGLPRVTEIFEARKPQGSGGAWRRSPARVELQADKRRGKMTIIVQRRRRHGEGTPRAAGPAAAGPRRRHRRGGRSAHPTARWCRTTSCASRAKMRCSSTCWPKCRTSTARRTRRSTTSTSRSSSRRCCAR